jgi:hypothetical protein
MNMRDGIVFRERSKSKVTNILGIFYLVPFASKCGCNRRYIRQPRFRYPDANWFASLEGRPRGRIKNNISSSRKAKITFN